jgi:Putative phage serine protease XkdF
LDNKEDNKLQGTLLRKSLDNEKRLAMFIVLEPQEDDGLTTDLHGDTYTAEEVEKACHSFNLFCRKANLLHEFETDSYSFVESYVLPVEAEIEGTLIKKGTWIAVVKADDDFIWDGIKDGTFNGLSIQCSAEYEMIE